MASTASGFMTTEMRRISPPHSGHRRASMPPIQSQDQRARVSRVVGDTIGLHFPDDRWKDLERGLRSASADLGFQDFDSFLSWLPERRLDRRETEILASHLTVGETYLRRIGILCRSPGVARVCACTRVRA